MSGSNQGCFAFGELPSRVDGEHATIVKVAVAVWDARSGRWDSIAA